MKIKLCDEFFYCVNKEKFDLENEFNSCKENILRNNNKLKYYSGEWVKIKVNNYITHHVKPAETLSLIAKTYGTEKEKIIYDNDLKSDQLFIGQKLKIYKV